MKVSSFGYRVDGAPADADLIVDCRHLPNPHGMHITDDEKRKWVLRHPDAETLVEQGVFHIENGGKHVAFGCLFGRHRSFAIATEVRRRLAHRGMWVEGLDRRGSDL